MESNGDDASLQATENEKLVSDDVEGSPTSSETSIKRRSEDKLEIEKVYPQEWNTKIPRMKIGRCLWVVFMI